MHTNSIMLFELDNDAINLKKAIATHNFKQ